MSFLPGFKKVYCRSLGKVGYMKNTILILGLHLGRTCGRCKFYLTFILVCLHRQIHIRYANSCKRKLHHVAMQSYWYVYIVCTQMKEKEESVYLELRTEQNRTEHVISCKLQFLVISHIII